MVGHGPFRAWHGKAFFTLPYSRIVIGDADKSIMLPSVPLVIGRRHKERAVALAESMNYAYRFGVKDVFRNRVDAMTILHDAILLAERNGDGPMYKMLTQIKIYIKE